MSTMSDFIKQAPLLPMLSIELKKTEQLDYKKPLNGYIELNYPGTNVNANIETLNQLRIDMAGASKDVQGRDIIYKYYGQLELLELHFPIGKEECDVNYTWFEAYKPSSKIFQNSIAYEKACVIFNLAAVLSTIASSQVRKEEGSLKTAFNYFQCAAGVFAFIKDNFLHAPSIDLSKEFISMLTNLMLAQAQECFVDKLILEDKKPQLIMKCSAQVAQFYQNAISSINDSLKTYIPSTFKAFMEIKLKYFLVHSNIFWCVVNESKYGESIGRLSQCLNTTKEALKSAQTELQGNNLMSKIVRKQPNSVSTPTSSVSFEESLNKVISFIQTKLVSANKDNDLLYHEMIPQNVSLTLQPTEMIVMAEEKKLTDTFPNIVQNVGVDLFEQILPISVHEQSSLYSEEKAKILRAQTALVDEANNDSEARLKNIKFKETLDLLKTTLKQKQGIIQVELPDSLSEIINSVSRNGSVVELKKNFDRLKTENSNCDMLIKELEALFKGQLSFENKLGQLKGNFDMGVKGDSLLFEKYRNFSYELESFSSKDILLKMYQDTLMASTAGASNAISLLDEPVVDFSGDSSEIQRLDASLQELYNLKKQRTAKLGEIKSKVLQDDISKLLVYNKSKESDVIKQELVKFQPLIIEIQENVKKSGEKIEAMMSSFTKLLNSRSPLVKQIEIERKKAGDFLVRMKNAEQAFLDLNFNTKKGLEFYTSLSKNLKELKSSYFEFLKTQANINENPVMNAGGFQAPAAVQSYSTFPSGVNNYGNVPVHAQVYNQPAPISSMPAPQVASSLPPSAPLALPTHLQPVTSLATVEPISSLSLAHNQPRPLVNGYDAQGQMVNQFNNYSLGPNPPNSYFPTQNYINMPPSYAPQAYDPMRPNAPYPGAVPPYNPGAPYNNPQWGTNSGRPNQY